MNEVHAKMKTILIGMIKLNNDIHIAFGYCGALKDWVANDHKKLMKEIKSKLGLLQQKENYFLRMIKLNNDIHITNGTEML